MEPGGQLNIQHMLEQAQRVQEQLLNTQQELAETEVTGTAGGGLVTVRASGQGEITGVSIDPKAIDASDPQDTAETVADLVLAAIRDASRAAADLQREKMGPLTEGLGGGLPGLGDLPEMPGLPGFPGTPGQRGS
ncbi:MAG TPA: YbaB/EbfC family nucleoid-associated protein [Streptosporangiaceae bacterium]|nr:YbaB/EbfC family nucleoid-associated protein [Streptosporangiaceae bacterium]